MIELISRALHLNNIKLLFKLFFAAVGKILMRCWCFCACTITSLQFWLCALLIRVPWWEEVSVPVLVHAPLDPYPWVCGFVLRESELRSSAFFFLVHQLQVLLLKKKKIYFLFFSVAKTALQWRQQQRTNKANPNWCPWNLNAWIQSWLYNNVNKLTLSVINLSLEIIYYSTTLYLIRFNRSVSWFHLKIMKWIWSLIHV
jgi:hypothetical protein